MTISLNPEQTSAVNFFEGAAIVIAGAGCGKTRIITNRILFLINEKQQPPEKIIALTFTNKAAKEMNHRLEDLYANQLSKHPYIGTFHSYCFFLLKKYAADFGLENFGILDSTDQTSLIKKILLRYGLEKEYPPKKILGIISSIKNGSTSKSLLENEPRIAGLFTEYEQEKNLSKNLDFDDLLLKVYKKLNEDSSFLEKVTSRIDHILIDEYQDTNTLQHNLIRLLATGPLNKNEKKFTLKIKSIFAVGDEDQAIYSWRGANVENMYLFLTDFKPATVLKVEQNYRSAQQILTAANYLIKNNKTRYEKKLWSTNHQENCIFVSACKNEFQEADIVAHAARITISQNPESTCAILYRNHHQSRLIEEALIQNKIRYKIIGGIKFYERKEIKDLLGYLKLFNNPSDWISFDRVINCPNRSLGDKFLEKIDALKNTAIFNTFYSILEYQLEQTNAEKQKQGILSFLNIFQGLDKELNIKDTFELILERTRYADFLRKEYESEEAETKIKNIEELAKSMEKFIQLNPNNATVKNFLDEIALIQEADSDSENQNLTCIELMTLHSAKGLEFDAVTIIGCEEGSLPSLRKDSSHLIEEERRLFYVGITRTKKRLLLTFAQNKLEYGKSNNYSASRFLGEIPQSLKIESSQNQNSFSLKNEVSLWLNEKKSTQQQFMPKHNLGQRDTFQPKNPNPSYSYNKIPPSYPFKLGSLVKHEVFGFGSIKKIEQSGATTFLEIMFKTGLKKINAAFIKTI